MKRSFFHVATDADSVAELTWLTRRLDVLKKWPAVSEALERWKPEMPLEKHIETVLLPVWQTLRAAEATEKELSFLCYRLVCRDPCVAKEPQIQDAGGDPRPHGGE